MNEINNINSIDIKNSFNNLIQNDNPNIKYSEYDNKGKFKKNKIVDNDRKNKSTQLFETLLGSN